MSKSVGGATGGAARGAVPEGAVGLIKDIREITGKQHSDEDIYTVLEDCNMDPNETAQRLLYIDTFHEVKSKRDRRKEIPGTQSRGARGGRGNYSANHTYPDARGRKNAASRRDNRVSYNSGKGLSASPQATEGRNDKAALPVTKDSSHKAIGTSSLSHGNSIPKHDPPSPDGGFVTKDNSAVNVKRPDTTVPLPAVTPSASSRTFISVVRADLGKSVSSSNCSLTSTTPTCVSGVYSSASDSQVTPPMAQQAGIESEIICEVGSQLKVAEQNHIEANGHASLSPKNEQATSKKISSIKKQKAAGKSKASAKNQLTGPKQVSSSIHDGSMCISSSSDDTPSPEESVGQAMVSTEDAQAEASAQKLSIPNGYVTFPDHLKVPEALKSGLIFGNFDATPGIATKYNNDNGCDINSTNAIQLSNEIDETPQESSPSNESVSTITHVDHSDKSESSQHVPEQVPQSECLVPLSADSNADQSKQEILMLPEGHQNNVQMAPNYGFGIMPTTQGDCVQYVGHEAQARADSHLLNIVSEYSTSSSSPSPSPSPPALNPAAASHPVFFRPPYPPNYFPYGHYFNPYFVPMHLLSHNGLPQQQAASPGAKLSLPLLKPGAGNGNPTPIPPLYGSFGSSPAGFNPSPAVTSGSSAGDEDPSASQLKECISGPLFVGLQREVSAWIPPQGQDMTSLQLNSLYQLHPQGQHLAFSPLRPGHGPYPGIFQAVQSIAAPSFIPPVEQSQAMSVPPTESIGTPAGAHQQPQSAQINLNPSY